MASSDITDNNKRPMHGVYAGNSTYNAVQTQINASLQRLDTTFLARIDRCSSGTGGSGTVDATPLVQPVDGNGNAYKTPSYPAMPHYRIQQGSAAIIMNPRPGDVGVFVCARRDISNVSAQNKQPGPPGSLRSFSPSDAIMVGSIHTEAPTYYIDFTSPGQILIHAPAGVTIETDAQVHITAASVQIDAPETTVSGHMTVQGGLSVSGGSGANVTGGLSATEDITAGGISLQQHVHGGVQSGSSTTGSAQ